MQCPVCETTRLAIAERQGIEIDYCPECRGVWLDRGELDKIIERSVGAQSSDMAGSASPSPSSGGPGKAHGGKHKRKSFLGELFDF